MVAEVPLALPAPLSLATGTGGASGITTLKGIAAALNARGIATARGGQWDATQVRRILARAGKAA